MNAPDVRLRFAAALSYRASTPQGLARQKVVIAQAVEAGLDADSMYQLLERHRIQSIALAVLEHTGMEEVLGHRLPELRKRATASRQNSLVLAMRGEQARRTIERAGVACLDFKGGPNLSRKLYGDLALRHSKDVDLIVHPQDLGTAARALQAEGWKIDDSPIWFSSRLHRTLTYSVLRDIRVVDLATGCHIELHNRFEVIPDYSMETPWWHAFESTERQYLSEADLLYLILHGTKHLWGLTKWLGDIAAIVESRPELIERSAPLARDLKLERMFPLLAYLMSDLYGMELPGYAPQADQGRQLASYCIASLEQKNTWHMNQIEIAIHYQYANKFHYHIFGPRAPLLRRVQHAFFSLLIRPKDIEAIGPYLWVLLPFLPVVRVVSLFWRYTIHAFKMIKARGGMPR